MQDITAIAAIAHARSAVVIADNTWATPLYFKPLAHGVDLSLQAATKYLGGHSDGMLGTVSANAEHWPALAELHRTLGLPAGPDDIYLPLRGMRTLSVPLARATRTPLSAY